MRRLTVTTAVILCLQFAGVTADAEMIEIPPPPIPNVTLVPPSSEDLVAAYPASARGRNLGGSVLLMCIIKADESTDCRVTQWNPGFDKAGAQIGQELRVKSNDHATHEGQAFNLRITFPADQPGSATAPLPVLGAITAALPNRPVPVPHAMRQPTTEEQMPIVTPVNGRAYDIDKSKEPWIVTFHLLGNARVRTCNDKDPVVSTQLAKPGETMPVGKNQRIELFEGMIGSWAVVSETNRCPGTLGYVPSP